jgi:hypothetical protein
MESRNTGIKISVSNVWDSSGATDDMTADDDDDDVAAVDCPVFGTILL